VLSGFEAMRQRQIQINRRNLLHNSIDNLFGMPYFIKYSPIKSWRSPYMRIFGTRVRPIRDFVSGGHRPLEEEMTYSTNSTRRIKDLGRFALPLFGIVAASLLVPASAKATLVLTLDEISGPDAGATVTESDPTNTDVSYIGPLGDFSANVDIGFSNESSLGSGIEATLQVHSLEVESTTSVAAIMQVTLSDSGFSFPGSSGDTLSLNSFENAATFVDAGTSDKVQFQSTAFDPTAISTTLQESDAPSGGSGTGSAPPDESTTFVRGTSYTLQNVTTLYFSEASEQENAGGTTTTLDEGSSVPEPTSLSAIALGGLLLTRRRRSIR
jgi:hypothetical protein